MGLGRSRRLGDTGMCRGVTWILCHVPVITRAEALSAMRRAIISDIHGNLEALEAVLADARAEGIAEDRLPRRHDRRWTQPARAHRPGDGDLQGRPAGKPRSRGPVRQGGIQLGDERHLLDEGTTRDLQRSDEQRATPGIPDGVAPDLQVGPDLYVHGSPRNPLSEYVFPEDIYNRRKMERLFQLFDRYCFQGHTHVPGIFTEDFQFFSPDEIDREYVLGDGKLMINVGSVGQPRDRDHRACYVILDGSSEEDAAGPPVPASCGRSCSDGFLTISRTPSGKSTTFPATPSGPTMRLASNERILLSFTRRRAPIALAEDINGS